MSKKYLFLFILIFLLIATLFLGCKKSDMAEAEEIESEEKAQESNQDVVSGLQDITDDLSDIEDIVE